MKNDRIRFIKAHCYDFETKNIQKKQKRNGDLIIYDKNKSSGSATNSKGLYDADGVWRLEDDGTLTYTYDSTELDPVILIHIDTTSDGYLYALMPYDIEDEVSFEIDNRGIFIINDN